MSFAGPGLSLVEIDDSDDERLSDYRSLTDVALRTRIEQPLGLFIAEGSLVIARALAAGYQMRSALVSPRWVSSLPSPVGDAPVYVASESLLEATTGFHVHRGALASFRRMPLPSTAAVLAQSRRVVVVEDLVNHTNLGAIFRSAGALGFDGVLLSPSSADPLYRRSVRVSMGGVFSLPWTRLADWPSLDPLHSVGFETWALTPAHYAVDLSVAVSSLGAAARVAVLLGTEGGGLSGSAQEAAVRRVRIPMAAGVDSLNVAAAAAVVFYALGQK